MRLFTRRAQRKLSDRIAAVVPGLTTPIGDSPVDDYFCCVLMGTVSAGASAIEEFADLARNEVVVEEVAAFVRALDQGADVRPPIRVAAWGYVNSLIDMNWSDRADEVRSSAEAGLGFRSEVERRVATLDPYAGTVGEAGMMMRLNRTVLSCVVESVTGETWDSSSDVASIVLWGGAFADNWGLYRRTLDYLAPDGPPET